MGRHSYSVVKRSKLNVTALVTAFIFTLNLNLAWAGISRETRRLQKQLLHATELSGERLQHLEKLSDLWNQGEAANRPWMKVGRNFIVQALFKELSDTGHVGNVAATALLSTCTTALVAGRWLASKVPMLKEGVACTVAQIDQLEAFK